jgi:hypothetical protein
MAVNTWDGAVSTDYNDAGNWNTTGETDRVPTSADDVVIPDTSSINNCALSATGGNPKNVNSIKIEANGTVVGNDIEFRVYGENSSGFAVDIDGIISGDLNIEIKTPTTTSIDMTASSGKVKNLTINDADSIVNAETTVDISNTLNVTLGEFKTNGNVLTVAGHISGNGTLTASTSTVSVTGQTTIATVNITTGTYNYFDDFRPTTCNITDNATFNQTSTGGQFGGRVIITASKTPTFNAVGRLHSTLDIQSGEQGNSTFNLDLSEPQTGPSRALFFHNLELDSQDTENNTLTMAGAITCTGDLTITDGIIDTSSSNHALTVAGNTVVDGTLTGNNSTFSFGTNGVHGSTEGGCLLVNSSGTFTFGSGDVTIFSGFTAKGTEGSPNVTSTGGGDIIIKGRTNNGFMNSHNHNGTNITGDYIIDYDNSSLFDNRGGVTIACGNFIVKHDGRTYEPWNNAAQATFKIVGNMDIQDGTFDTEYSGQDSQHLTVTGDCDVTGTLTLNGSTVSVGALRTQSGAVMTQDSDGTLTLAVASNFGGTEGASYSWRNEDGTSDINLGGTTTVTAAGYFEPRTAPDYASVVNNVVWNTNYYWVGKMTFGGTLVVNASKLMQTYNGSQDCIVTGDVTLNGHLKALGDNVSAMTFGSLTIASGGTYTATSGTTTITTGAFDITTTSFDLGAKTLVFSGTNASFLSATNATFSAGPGATITGKAADDKTDFDCQKNFQVVGTVENLNNNGPGSLMVTGQVINCDGNIIQLKPTQDSEQQLDKSSEADRETSLGRDLDGNTELVG